MSIKIKLFSLSLTQTRSGVTQEMWRHQQPPYTSGSVKELISSGGDITFSRHSFPCCWFLVFVVGVVLGDAISSKGIGFKSKNTKYVCQKVLFKHRILVFEKHTVTSKTMFTYKLKSTHSRFLKIFGCFFYLTCWCTLTIR